MNKIMVTTMLAIVMWGSVFAQQDTEGTKDNALFPNRMANYIRSESTINFDAVDFNIAASGAKIITKEGTKSMVRYDFNTESGQSKPSCLQILRNYEAAAKKIGGETQFLSVNEGLGVFKIVKTGAEVWVKVETIGNDNSDAYIITVLEVEAMKQEITSNDILKALNTEGHISLYINFETGKSVIKPESQPIIDEVATMLQSDPALKISIEGHTDNVGTPASNQTLSESRAKAVMNAVITKGIDKTRLVSKGWGQTKSLMDNKTDEGKAKNRRVEIVKI